MKKFDDDVEEDTGIISLKRSDGRANDLNIFAGKASKYLEKVSAELATSAAAAPQVAEVPINIKRSDGDSHDIIKVLKSKSDIGRGNFSLKDSIFSTIRRFSQSKITLEDEPKPQLLTQPYIPKSVRIVHLSDTFNWMCRGSRFDQDFLPKGDILIHSGNFTCNGLDEEYEQFDGWLSSISDRYPYRIVVAGKRDVRQLGNNWSDVKRRLPHATHVLCHSEITVLGIRIYGCPWYWGQTFDYSQKPGVPVSDRFPDIPDGVHVLVTAGPARGRLDRRRKNQDCNTEHIGSVELAAAIQRARPGAHLHGHTTENRGVIPHFNDIPLTVNSTMCSRDGAVLCACPHVIEATRLFASALMAIVEDEASTPRFAPPGETLWDFHMGSLLP